MIPKTIHYCWFGGKPLPPLAIKCLESWNKYLPVYEIIEWNESNFPVNSIPYTKEAADKGKWAFVSDYARFYILYHNGGIYLDTDVEILKSLNPFLKHHSFSGFESKDRVAPGLILGAKKGCSLMKKLMNSYHERHFINQNGLLNEKTVVSYMTEELVSEGLVLNGELQNIHDFIVYPIDFFSPKSLETGKLKITSNTYSIHHYAGSWMSNTSRLKRYVYLLIAKVPFVYKMYNKIYRKY